MSKSILPDPQISIITVVFNAQDILEGTILSVLNQTYPHIEYILVDGASTDNTLEIIKKYESRIGKWISEKDKGIYDAMNKGISMAQGNPGGDKLYVVGDIRTTGNLIGASAA